MSKQCNFDLLDEGCIFFNAVCKYFPTKHCNPNKNYIVRTAGDMIMHGGIQYLLTGAAEDEIESLTICMRPSLGSFLSCRKCDEAVPSKKNKRHRYE